MMHLRNLGIGVMFFASISLAASRLETLADRLAMSAASLAADSYRGFSSRDGGNRADVEALYLIQQFDAGAALFRRMVRDRRPDSELRDSVVILSNQARSSQRFNYGRREWQDMTRTLDEITRELEAGRSRFENYPSPSRVTGHMRWRGKVDGHVQLFVQGSTATPRAISGAPVLNAAAEFTSPLPRREANTALKKLKGRGTVEVIQQPSRDNDYTAVIRINDPKGGADDYELELVW